MEPCTINVTTGDCSNRLGSTRLMIGVVNPRLGNYTVRDLQRAGGQVTSDRVTANISSSTAGDRAGGMLGYWAERMLTVAGKQLFFVDYQVKTIRDPIKKRAVFAIMVDETCPWMELSFPTITDAYSTKQELTISGRFRIGTKEEIGSVIGEMMEAKFSVPPILLACVDFFAQTGEGKLEAHWKTTVKETRGNENKRFPFMSVSLTHEEVTIHARQLLPGKSKIKLRSQTKKVTESVTGKKLTIVRPGRRIRMGR